MMKDHALQLVAAGYLVIPLHNPVPVPDDVPGGWSGRYQCSCGDSECHSPGKHPRTRNGVRDASSNVSDVDRWWSQEPFANIGVATGFSADVIDIDGPDGRSVFDDYVQRFGFPEHVGHALTGRDGGEHYWVPNPGGVGQQSWTGGTGGHPLHLDVKGRGGYVVAPPSLHESGRRYEWREPPWAPGIPVAAGHAPVDWPTWHDAVIASLVATRTHSGRIQDPPRSSLFDVEQPRSATGLGFLDTVVGRITDTVLAAPEGARWQTLSTVGIWDAAGLVNGGELDEPDAVAFCQAIAARVGLTPAEVRRIPTEVRRAIDRRRNPIAHRVTASGPSTARTAVAAPGRDPTPAGDAGPTPAGATEADLVDARTAHERVRILAQERARDELRRERLGAVDYPPSYTLDELLTRPLLPVRYRVDGLWPIGGRVMLAAQFKAGKTTLIGNLARALADGSHFLSRYAATQPEGTIGLFDTEMSDAALQGWLRDQNIGNPGRVWVAPVRGTLSTFDITDPIVRDRWAQEIKARNTSIVLFDCLGPALAALGLDENSSQDQGKFINAFEMLLAQAGVDEAMIVHHMGHFGERLRGSSRLRDWPDAEWLLIREGQEDERASVDADAPRYFKAFGRDVNVREQAVTYDPQFRWLSVSDGNRSEVREQRIRDQILAALNTEPGMSSRTLEMRVKGKATAIREALKSLLGAGTVRAVPGPHRAICYYRNDYVATLSDQSDEPGDET